MRPGVARRAGAARLRDAGVASPDRDAELLLAHVLDVPLGRLADHIRKLPKSLQPNQVTDVRARLRALDARIDLDQVCEALTFVEGVCAGDERGGAAAGAPVSQRFGFLKAPRSTVLQPGPVHGGVTEDPARQLEHLLERFVG